MENLTEDQVIKLLVAVQMFSSANHNQGLLLVSGHNFEERAETMLTSFIEVEKSGNASLLNIISKFKSF